MNHQDPNQPQFTPLPFTEAEADLVYPLFTSVMQLQARLGEIHQHFLLMQRAYNEEVQQISSALEKAQASYQEQVKALAAARGLPPDWKHPPGEGVFLVPEE